MFCSKCGAQMPQGSGFCTSCGTSFAPAAQQQPAAPVQPQPVSISQPPVKKPINKKIIMIGGAALVVVAIAVTLILVLGGNRIVGTWQYTASEEWVNGRLDWSRQAGQWDNIQITFNRNGTGTWVENNWSDPFNWSTSGNRLTLTDGWDSNTFEFRINGNELRLIERYEWWGENWEDHMIFHRR